ncbi:MAG: aminotransferase class IV [Planctomycetota bacterium]
MTIWIDGDLQPGNDVPRSKAFAPFETMGAKDAQLALWPRHLERLQGSAERLGLAFAPPPDLRAAAADVLLKNGESDGILRLALVPDDQGGGPARVVMGARSRSPIQKVRLLPTVVERPADAPPGDMKAEPRRFYDEVRNQAQDGGADDGIVVGNDGMLLETALGNLWLRVDGVWRTPALDGRVLPGVARALLLEFAKQAGFGFEERECTLDDLHHAEAMAHSNAVYGPRPACLADDAGSAVGNADSLVADELGVVWQEALASFGGSGA